MSLPQPPALAGTAATMDASWTCLLSSFLYCFFSLYHVDLYSGIDHSFLVLTEWKLYVISTVTGLIAYKDTSHTVFHL